MKKEDGKRSGSPMKFVLILSAVLVIAAGTAGYFLHRSSEDVNRTAVTAANNTAEQSFEKAEEESSVMPETESSGNEDMEEAKWSIKYFTAVDHISRKTIITIMTEYRGFTEDQVEKAIQAVNPDFREVALKCAEQLEFLHLSKAGQEEWLVDIEDFTAEEARYAIEHLKRDWNEQAALEAAELKSEGYTKDDAYYQLTEIQRFTPSEAQYAIDHSDWN